MLEQVEPVALFAINMSDAYLDIPTILIGDGVIDYLKILQADQPGVQTWYDPKGKLIASAFQSGETNWMHWPGLALFGFDLQSEVVHAFPEASTDPELIKDIYYRSVLPLVLHIRGLESLHASAVRTPNGVIGFPARSGSGKSTIAYGLSRRGFSVWSDDALTFFTESSSTYTYRLPGDLRLLPDSLAHYQNSLPAHEITRAQNQDNIPGRERLRALLILDRQPANQPAESISIDMLHPSQALTKLLPNAYYFDRHDTASKEQFLSHYLALAEAIPTYHMQYNTGLDRNNYLLDQIERFLENPK